MIEIQYSCCLAPKVQASRLRRFEQLQKPLKGGFQKQNDRDSIILYEHCKKPLKGGFQNHDNRE